jgi:histidyl-tRNA synthetase
MHALLEAAGIIDEGSTAVVYAQIDKLGREPTDVLKDRIQGAGLSARQADQVLAYGEMRGLDAVRAALRGAARADALDEPLAMCVAALQDMGLGAFVEVDLSIVRGLAYYTGIVFELFDAQGTLRAICGGGRYDGLLQAVGGADLPAVGFGMGDVVLGELLRTRQPGNQGAAIDAFLVAVGGEDRAVVLEQAHALRDAGCRIEYALREQSVAKQMKLAAARGARCAIVIGPAERESGEVIVRTLRDGSEVRVPFGMLGARLQDGVDA